MKLDEQIRQNVIDALELEPSIEASRIGVAVKDGIVTLSGKVDAYGQKIKAERIAQQVPGIKGLAEDLIVNIPGISQRTDADICETAVNTLRWDVTVPDTIKVKVENGQVTLTGKVKFGFQKLAAEEALHKLLGVRGIVNAVEIEPPAKADQVKSEIGRVFRRNMERDLGSISVQTHDGVATLRGTVRSWVEREDAAKAAQRVPGVAFVENRLIVSA